MFRRDELPVAVRVPPEVRPVTTLARGLADVEVRVELAHSRSNMFVEAFFGDRAFASPPLAGRLFLVLIVQPESHGAQNHVETLQQHMIAGLYLGNLVGTKSDASVAEVRVAVQPQQVQAGAGQVRGVVGGKEDGKAEVSACCSNLTSSAH